MCEELPSLELSAGISEVDNSSLLIDVNSIGEPNGNASWILMSQPSGHAAVFPNDHEPKIRVAYVKIACGFMELQT